MTTPLPDLEVVASTGWAGAKPEQVEAICRSVASCFADAIAERPVEPIRIAYRYDHPRTLFDRDPDGRIVVQLHVRGQLTPNLVCKTGYQFAHEFVHVLTGVRREPPDEFFEECLADLSSLFALRALAEQWRTDPPYDEWRKYAPAFSAYRDIQLADQPLDIPPGRELPEWFAEQWHTRHASWSAEAPEALTIVALAVTPLTNDPAFWPAVRYLPSVDLDAYFDAWRTAAPTRLHGPIDQLEGLLMIRD